MWVTCTVLQIATVYMIWIRDNSYVIGWSDDISHKYVSYYAGGWHLPHQEENYKKHNMKLLSHTIPGLPLSWSLIVSTLVLFCAASFPDHVFTCACDQTVWFGCRSRQQRDRTPPEPKVIYDGEPPEFTMPGQNDTDANGLVRKTDRT